MQWQHWQAGWELTVIDLEEQVRAALDRAQPGELLAEGRVLAARGGYEMHSALLQVGNDLPGLVGDHPCPVQEGAVHVDGDELEAGVGVNGMHRFLFRRRVAASGSSPGARLQALRRRCCTAPARCVRAVSAAA